MPSSPFNAQRWMNYGALRHKFFETPGFSRFFMEKFPNNDRKSVTSRIDNGDRKRM